MKKIIVYVLSALTVLAGIVGLCYFYSVNSVGYLALLPLTGLVTYPSFKHWTAFFSKYINLWL